MKKLRVSFGAKLTATIIAVITISLCLLSVFGIGYLAEQNYYYDNGSQAIDLTFEQIGKQYSKTVIYDYYPQTINQSSSASGAVNKYTKDFSKDNTNFSFTLYDNASGSELLHNFDCGEYIYSNSYSNQLALNDGTESELTVTYFVASGLTAKDGFYYAKSLSDFLASVKFSLIAVFAGAFILTAVLIIYLIYSVGCKRGADGGVAISLSFLDRIPLDLFIIIGILLFSLTSTFLSYFGSGELYSYILRYCTLLELCLLIFLLIITMSARCKKGNPLINTLIYKIISRLFGQNGSFAPKLKDFLRNISLVWRAAIIIAAISAVELILLIFTSRTEYIVFWIVEKLVLVPIMLMIATDIKEIQTSIDRIAGGDIDYNIEPSSLSGMFRKYGEKLNDINGTMQRIVDERMKSERFKTELITNVSHDIKTPLTSVVTYVDLLKTQDISPESARDYIDVLDRNAKKLTKLINDLVDASQASTGNVTVNAELGDAGVMLTQAVAEFDDKLNSALLTPIVTVPDRPLMIMADGRLLWRVFENLLSNICKYSLKNTRVYMSAAENAETNRINITFSNISSYPLNISSDELMERFVRGDSSRNTEGSGLGLSIAKSLVTLQNGTFDIIIDGDMFKVVIGFDKATDKEG